MDQGAQMKTSPLVNGICRRRRNRSDEAPRDRFWTMRAIGVVVLTIYRLEPSCAAFSVYESCISGRPGRSPGGPAGIFDHHLLSIPQRVRRLLTNGVVHLVCACNVTRQLGPRQSARTCRSFMGSGDKAWG